MPHTGAIRTEVARLDWKANDIEQEATQLVNDIEMQQQTKDRKGYGVTWSVYVFKPDTSQEARLRKLAADYEAWYNAANELVHMYLPNRADDFESYYSKAGYLDRLLQEITLRRE